GTTITTGVVSAPGTTVGNVLVGGPVMGEVKINGNINTFYSAWLLTGDTYGEFQNVVSDPDNFFVVGDIRNLLGYQSIGTDSDVAQTLPTYVTGFDMHVAGTIGEVRDYNDSIIGNVNADHSPVAQGIGINQTEIENLAFLPPEFDFGILNADPHFTDDTFMTPQ